MSYVFKRSFNRSSISLVARKSKLGKVLPLDEFVFRQEVLKVYRSILRACHKSHEKYDLIKFARDEFKMQNKETELTYRKYLLNDGIAKANQVIKMVGLSDVPKIHRDE